MQWQTRRGVRRVCGGVKSNFDNERVRISTDEIIVIESFGHDIVIRSAQGEFKASERLYQLERLLNPEFFCVSAIQLS